MTPQKTDLVRELLGTLCACGSPKTSKRTFCLTCYRALPHGEQVALYKRVGNGYEEAYEAAVKTLKSKGRIAAL